MGSNIIVEDLKISRRIIDKDSIGGKKIHEFLLERAKKLLGHIIDFDKTPVTFVLADDDRVNAFYAHKMTKNNRPHRSEYEDIRYEENTYPSSVICINKGVINLVDNLDQLDHILIHELTHMLAREYYGVANNSKGEEALADIHPIDVIYDTGGDPKQSLLLEEKIDKYIKAERKKEENKRNYRSKKKTKGINWSEIFDIHVSRANIKAGTEASLTRISHLIDDRTPTPIDKSIFDASYTDPVEEYLSKTNFKNEKQLGKIKILVDAIDALSHKQPAKEYYTNQLKEVNAELDSLSDDEKNSSDAWDLEREKHGLEKKLKENSFEYFNGPVIEKKYQQKIAKLAEEIIQSYDSEETFRPKRMHNVKHLLASHALKNYIINKAYNDIQENGYPHEKSDNYYKSAALMYTYFYTLMENKFPNKDNFDPNKLPTLNLSKLEEDIVQSINDIKFATTLDTAEIAINNYYFLKNSFERVIKTSIGKEKYGSYGNKLYNLSFLEAGYYGSKEKNVYARKLKENEVVQWNNLVSIYKNDSSDKKDVIVKFLNSQSIEDFRITHNKPYIRTSRFNIVKLDDNGKIIDANVSKSELDYIINEEVVLESYNFIRDYFDNEEDLFKQACNDLLNISEEDYINYPKKSNKQYFERLTLAGKKIYDFISLYNSIISETEENNEHEYNKITDFIAGHFLSNTEKPWYNKETKRNRIEDNVFYFDNSIFQEHFDKNCREKLIIQKKKYQEQMFQTMLSALEKVESEFKDVVNINNSINRRMDKLWKKKEETSNKEIKEILDKESVSLSKASNKYKRKEQILEEMIYNYTHSIFNGTNSSRHIHKLTDAQKQIIAKFVVEDKEGVFIKLFSSDTYTYFCDYAGVLESQMDKVISGDYSLTDDMQIVARNIKYDQNKVLKKKHRSDRRDKKEYKYAEFIKAFSLMEKLEETSSVNILELANFIDKINVSPPNSYNNDNYGMRENNFLIYSNFVYKSNLVFFSQMTQVVRNIIKSI